jgi:arsenite methyltransferase
VSGPVMLVHLMLERLSRRELPRVAEAAPLMDAPEQVIAFLESGRDDGILAFLYFFHAMQVTPLIRPGDTVVDLACGPANQLAQIARLNPQAQFIGIDASVNMLDQAKATLARCAVGNVRLQHGDMTRLVDVEDASIDCALSTMSLHHLPNGQALERTMLEIRRILRPGGGVYLADFGRLRRTATQRYFAHDRADCQSAQFTRDYFDSLRAAFSVDELTRAAAELNLAVERHYTALAPFMVILKSAARRELDAGSRRLAQQMYRQMTAGQQKDFRILARWFRVGGYVRSLSLD